MLVSRAFCGMDQSSSFSFSSSRRAPAVVSSPVVAAARPPRRACFLANSSAVWRVRSLASRSIDVGPPLVLRSAPRRSRTTCTPPSASACCATPASGCATPSAHVPGSLSGAARQPRPTDHGPSVFADAASATSSIVVAALRSTSDAPLSAAAPPSDALGRSAGAPPATTDSASRHAAIRSGTARRGPRRTRAPAGAP